MRVERLSPWLLKISPDQPARARLVCFPYAGGGISAYRRWSALPAAGSELLAVQLPGHEDRYGEALVTRLADLIPPLVNQIVPLTDGGPFALFGHSMGALIAFELARELRRLGRPAPSRLFVSGRRAPHLAGPGEGLHLLDDATLKARLRRFNGTPALVLENDELMDLLLPVLRADFEICETYTCVQDEPLDVPIAAFGGSHDPEATREELDAWARHSVRPLQVRVFPGNHFFLHEQADALGQAIAEGLERS